MASKQSPKQPNPKTQRRNIDPRRLNFEEEPVTNINRQITKKVQLSKRRNNPGSFECCALGMPPTTIPSYPVRYPPPFRPYYRPILPVVSTVAPYYPPQLVTPTYSHPNPLVRNQLYSLSRPVTLPLYSPSVPPPNYGYPPYTNMVSSPMIPSTPYTTMVPSSMIPNTPYTTMVPSSMIPNTTYTTMVPSSMITNTPYTTMMSSSMIPNTPYTNMVSSSMIPNTPYTTMVSSSMIPNTPYTNMMSSPMIANTVMTYPPPAPYQPYSPIAPSLPSQEAFNQSFDSGIHEPSGPTLNSVPEHVPDSIELKIQKSPVRSANKFKPLNIEEYLRLPRDLFPTARMLGMNPNPIINEFCIEPDIVNIHSLWILDLEFGIPKEPVTRQIATYDIQFNSIHCKNTPGAIHPGFESCSPEFRSTILFYYDSVISARYRGFVIMNSDRNVANFQSWLQEPMQEFGMCWP